MAYLDGLRALVLYAALPLVLALGYVVYRVLTAATQGVPLNAWGRAAPREQPQLFTRMQHAQLNVLENLPVFAALVLAAYFERRALLVDAVAPYILGARIAQTTIHLVGTTPRLVFARGSFWLVQVSLFMYLAVELLR